MSGRSDKCEERDFPKYFGRVPSAAFRPQTKVLSSPRRRCRATVPAPWRCLPLRRATPRPLNRNRRAPGAHTGRAASRARHGPSKPACRRRRRLLSSCESRANSTTTELATLSPSWWPRPSASPIPRHWPRSHAVLTCEATECARVCSRLPVCHVYLRRRAACPGRRIPTVRAPCDPMCRDAIGCMRRATGARRRRTLRARGSAPSAAAGARGWRTSPALGRA